MSSLFDVAVQAVTLLVGDEDLAKNLVAEAIWAVPSTLSAIVVIIYRRSSGVPTRIWLYRAFFVCTKWLRINRISVDGFYCAVYDSSKSPVEKPKKRRSGKVAGENGGESAPVGTVPNAGHANTTRVVECVYIHSSLFSNRIRGHVFRRAKRKNGVIEEKQNNYYSSRKISSPIRIEGCFSQALQIFYGYWLDPYEPNEVSGSVRLKWIDNNTGLQAQERRVILVGHWDGVNKNIVVPIDESSQKLLGFAPAGGVWHFYRIGTGFSEFRRWKNELIEKGDRPNDPAKFLDWVH